MPQPPSSIHRTRLAGLESDLHVELGGWLGEGEETGAEADLGVGSEVGPGELEERGLEVGHGHAAIDVQAFDLVEHERVGGVDGVGSVDAAGGDDLHRGAGPLGDGLFHRADLHGGGLAAEHARGVHLVGVVDIEVVDGIAGGVPGGMLSLTKLCSSSSSSGPSATSKPMRAKTSTSSARTRLMMWRGRAWAVDDQARLGHVDDGLAFGAAQRRA
jgi:hypothetical protein